MPSNHYKRIHSVFEALEDEAGKFLTDIATRTAAELAKNSPVDTGWLKNNFTPWAGTKYSKPDWERPTDDVEMRVGAAAGVQGTAMVDVIASAHNWTPGKSTGVVNNVPYLHYVDDSGSANKRIEPGWVGRAIAHAEQVALTKFQQRVKKLRTRRYL